MNKTSLFITAVVGVTLALPLMAHHNSPLVDELVIGDMMERHETAIDTLNLPDSAMGAMDPSDGDTPSDAVGSMPEDFDAQPNGSQIPDDPGTDNGGSTAGQPWPED